MSDEDKLKMFIAHCLTCLIAECMKDCQNCPFNVGLPFKNLTVEEFPISIIEKIGV